MNNRAIAFLAVVGRAVNAFPQGVTSAIAPSEPVPQGCNLNFPSTFGLAVVTLSGGAPAGPSAAAVATQSPDGQAGPGKSSATPTPSIAPVAQISDGQIQRQTTVPLAQISDGQVQRQSTLIPITQISDGQIQASYSPVTVKNTTPVTFRNTTAVTVASTTPVTVKSTSPVTVANTSPVTVKSTSVSAQAISQISDHQPQAPPTPTTATSVGTSVYNVASTSVYNTASTSVYNVASTSVYNLASTSVNNIVGTSVYSTLVTNRKSARQAAPTGSSNLPAVACRSQSALTLSLNNGVLLDNQGRTGYIASNYQFQFDKPAQAGAIFTSGFSVCPGNSTIALGGITTFYQCLSGDFYNIYDRNFGAGQCIPIQLQAIQLQNC